MASQQSTRHLLMIEPAAFYANPETMETNMYQVDQDESADVLFQRALKEWRDFRDLLVENGVFVASALGYKNCPDMVFPNWASTHEGGRLVLYPMMNNNRRAERAPEVIEMLRQTYPDVIDLTHFENDGLFLEARGSLVCDRVNKVAYAALSKRTNREMVERWADMMDYEAVIFDTKSHTGQPVYHTDLVMYIGGSMIGVVSDCIVEDDRERVLQRLNAHHDVVEFSMDQLKTFCGNSLEVYGQGDQPMLALSRAAHDSLTAAQRTSLMSYYVKLLHSPLPTLEKYGGGSARCCLMELF